MGGYGSGKWARSGTKDTIEGTLPLDIRALHRKGLLQPGWEFTSRWWRGENKEAGSSIRGHVYLDHVLLSYRHRRPGGEWQDVEQRVWIERTPCHFGGERPWWQCPRCARRCAVLHVSGKHYACRQCYDLVYPSQNEGPVDRARERAQKAREKLGGSGSLFEPIPLKPKGMHHTTYARLRMEAMQRQIRSWQALISEFECMDRRTARIMRRLLPDEAP